MTEVLTLGHSRHTLERFVALLRDAGVTLLVDVRSHPVSRFAPQFDKARLAASLEAVGIGYRFLGAGLGGRPADPTLLGDDGQPIPERVVAMPAFQAALAELLALLPVHTTCLMCAEEDPQRCHREHLLGVHLRSLGVEVRHLRAGAQLALDLP